MGIDQQAGDLIRTLSKSSGWDFDFFEHLAAAGGAAEVIGVENGFRLVRSNHLLRDDCRAVHSTITTILSLLWHVVNI